MPVEHNQESSGCCSKGKCTASEVQPSEPQDAPAQKSCEQNATNCCSAGTCGEKTIEKAAEESCCAAGTCGANSCGSEVDNQQINATPLDIVIWQLANDPAKKAAFCAASEEERQEIIDRMMAENAKVFAEEQSKQEQEALTKSN